jgi:hypothetical protein
LQPINSTAIGDTLESRIYALLKNEIETDRFFAKSSCCKLFRKKGYYSKDRNSNIVFDLSIEIYLPGAEEYSMLWLIECKNYTHAVPVDDAEEFFAKVQQVSPANSKAVMATTAAFQSGTRAYAKSKGIGLVRYFEGSDLKWELRRSASASARSASAEMAFLTGTGLSDPNFKSTVFDLYMQTPTRETNSLWDFAEDLFSSSILTLPQVRQIANSRDRLCSQVPFIEKEKLEAIAAETLSEVGYSDGQVSLRALCTREAENHNLVVNTGIPAVTSDERSPVLGRITFDPLHITVYVQPKANRGRERFTLAHELAHHLLNHQNYMMAESCIEGDFVPRRQRIDDGTDIARMEFQANYLAASLLMPRPGFAADFWRVADSLELKDKGFGPLFVDDQPCNLKNFGIVTNYLVQRYGVSVTAAKIRLEGLGLLRDGRANDDDFDIQALMARAYGIAGTSE